MSDLRITSECPNCGEERVQVGYEQSELIQLLRTGAMIDAYCMACDEHWELSVEERADITRLLNR